MGTGEFTAGGNPAMDWHPIQGGVEILLVVSCYSNRDKLRPDGPLGSNGDFTLHCLHPRWNVTCATVTRYKISSFAILFKLPDEVCVIRRNW